MSVRISHSLLDPLLLPLVPRLYRRLRLPRRLWPEAIVLTGHLVALAGAVGMALATSRPWAGLLAAAGVAGNHLADMIDGTHARATGQCRNGGELLDHFTDPLSFTYWIIGIAVSIGRLDMGLAAVVILYATALLTSIKAKMTGRFELARFGPTEFKALLVLYGCGLSMITAFFSSTLSPVTVATVFLAVMLVVGVVQLAVNLVRSVREVNAKSAAPADTSAWQLKGSDRDPHGEHVDAA